MTASGGEGMGGGGGISIVIPSRDDRKICRCLQSVDSPAEVLVVLNGSDREYIDFVKGLPGIRVLLLPEANLGWAFDTGVEEARNDLVLLTNTDCEFAPGAIKGFQQRLEEFDCVRGKVIFLHYRWLQRIVARNREYAYQGNIYNPGLAFHKRLKDRIGYFFDHDIHWTEDADFSRRVLASEATVCFAGDLVVYHSPVSLRHDLRSAFRAGVGRRIAEEKGLFGTVPGQARAFPRIMLREWRRKKEFGCKIYGTTWWLWYIVGYLGQIVLDPYQVRQEP